MKQGLGLIIVIMILIGCKTPKNKSLNTIPETPTVIPLYDFPFEWIGEYKGELVILTSPKDSTVIEMGLKIGQPDASGLYSWVISYGETDKRYYGLEAINVEKGHYRIDELNSIKLDGYLRGNHFVTRFEVMGSDLLVDYEKKPEGISIRFYVSGAAAINETGGEIFGQDTVPTVKSYPIFVIQDAWLKETIN